MAQRADKNRRSLLSLLIIAEVLSTAVGAKRIDYSPQVLSDRYWSEHDVVLVRLTAVDQDRVSFVVESSISGSLDRKELPRNQLWFGQMADDLQLIVGQHFVLYSPRGLPLHAMVAAVPVANASSPYVNSIQAIARLHAGATGSTLRQAAFDPDSLVARYALRRLLSDPSLAQGFGEARLAEMLDDGGRPLEVRLLAVELLATLKGEGHESEREYQWLISTIPTAGVTDFSELTPLVSRLLDFDGHRVQISHLMADLATGRAVPIPVRIAAYGSFQDPRLLRAKQPDEATGVLFGASAKLVADPDALMRRAGAFLLASLVESLSAGDRPRYALLALQALRIAHSRENDEATRAQIGYAADRIERATLSRP